MRIYFFSLLVLFFVIPCRAQLKDADVSSIKNKYIDLPYASLSESQKLDIYLPQNGTGPFPVILSVHGGGFMAGDKKDRQVEPMLSGLKRGYAVVAINYRLSGEAIWPAQIYDCKAAVRWIKANAQKYNLDADHIVAWGGSAGGHLSSLLGTSSGVAKLEGSELGNAGQSSRVQAVIDWFGPTNFLKMDEQLKESGFGNPMVHSIPTSPESILLGKNLEDVPSLVKESDPGTYISPDDPPFFIQHGIEDTLVPYQGSVLLARKLGKVLGAKNVQLELFPATGHGNGPAFYTNANFDRIFNFMDLHLKSNPEKAEHGFVKVGGYMLQYIVKGEGIPCLVIGSSVFYPKAFSDELLKHLKMYFVDMRWFAPELSGEPVNAFTIPNIVEDIEQIRKYFELEKPVLIGHSIHGAVAMEYAKAHPDNISSIVMIGSPNIFGNETYDKAVSTAWEKASDSRKELQKNNWIQLSKTKDKLSEAQLIMEEYCTMGPVYWFDPTQDAHWIWEGTTVRADLLRPLYSELFHNYVMFANKTQAPVPTLVALGKYDFVIPPNLWERDKNIGNLTTVVFEKSGHLPQMEEFTNFDAVLLNWIRSNNTKQ
jgi:acetyl esterase/lipase